MRRSLLSLATSTALNVCLMFAQNSKTTSRTVAAQDQDYVFTVSASQGWVDTNIDLYPGDRVYVSGAVTACAGATQTDKVDVPLRSAPVWSFARQAAPGSRARLGYS